MGLFQRMWTFCFMSFLILLQQEHSYSPVITKSPNSFPDSLSSRPGPPCYFLFPIRLALTLGMSGAAQILFMWRWLLYITIIIFRYQSLFYEMYLYKDFGLRRPLFFSTPFWSWSSSCQERLSTRKACYGIAGAHWRLGAEKWLSDWKTCCTVGGGNIYRVLHDVYWSLHTCAEIPLNRQCVYVTVSDLYSMPSWIK